VIIENRGQVPAQDVFVIEQSTQHQIQIGTLQASQRMEIPVPLNSTGASYTLVADPQNLVAESDENNNVFSYFAPTPTPPALCPPTLPPTTPSPQTLEGLRFADLNISRLCLVSSNGTILELIDGINGQFSPNGTQELFERSGDLWLAEPMDNPGYNLTDTPDRFEQFPQWWAANPAKIVFNSMGSNEAQEKNWDHNFSGYLSMMNNTGADYIVLSDIPSYTRPALSGDGRTIAYEELGIPMLFEIGAGSHSFDTSLYGYQTEILNAAFTSPSFSPDGRWLTWWLSEGPFESQRHFSLVMFDLVGNTSRVLHSYTPPAGILGWLEPPVWSPGGQWIAFQTRGEEAPYDLWVIHRDGGIGNRLGLATHPVWSADNQRLAYVQWPPRADSNLAASTAILSVPSWNVEQTSLPAGSIPLAWPAWPY
jgi:Tol biopolymer transport system component